MSEASLSPDQEARVRLLQIREAFFSLPEEQRAALHLVAVEGLSYEDAAAALAIPLGTLMSRISRARAALRAFEDGAADDPALPAPAPRIPKPNLRVVGGADD